MMELENQVELICAHHVAMVDDFKKSIDRYAQDESAPMLKLLTCNAMIPYQLFDANQGNLSNMASLFHSLHHAFIDDGDYVVHRRECPAHKDMYERMQGFNEKCGKPREEYSPKYRYYIKSDCSYERMSITPEQLGEVVDIMQKPYDFYEEHMNEIEEGGFDKIRDKSSKYNQWRQLDAAGSEYLEKLYNESFYE